MRILLVEDDPLVLRVTTRILEQRLDAEVVAATTLSQAVDALRQGDLDLVITDVYLGEDSGIDVARAAALAHPAPPVVAISGGSNPADGLQLGRAGVAAFVAKPFDASTLIDIITRLKPPEELELAAVVRRLVGSRPMREVLGEVRRSMVAEALARSGGNKAQAASLLGISRQHLQKILARGQA